MSTPISPGPLNDNASPHKDILSTSGVARGSGTLAYNHVGGQEVSFKKDCKAAQKERDEYEALAAERLIAYDAMRAELDSMRGPSVDRAALLAAESEAATLRAQLVRAGNALRLIADAIREERPIAEPKRARKKRTAA